MTNCLIPVIAGLLLLKFPNWFISKKIDDHDRIRKTKTIKKIGVVLIIISAVYLAAAVVQNFGKHADKNTGLVMHQTQAGKPNDTGWYEAKSTEGHFAVSLPIPFNDFTTINEDEDGNPAKAFVIGSKSAEGFKFSAVEIQKNNPNPKEAVQAFASGYKSEPSIKVTGEDFFDYQGHPAAQLRLTTGSMSGVTRFIALTEKNYLLTVEYPSKKDEEVSPLVEPFLDSLKIGDVSN